MTLWLLIPALMSVWIIAPVTPANSLPGPSPSTGCIDDTCGAEGFDLTNETVNTPKKGESSEANPAPTSAPSAHCKPGVDPDCYGPTPVGTLTPLPKAPSESQLRRVATQLKLPDPTPRFGPDPSVNEWKMLAVGFPIWLWTDRPTTVSTTAHHDGLTFTLTATWTSTTFTMGDGHSKTCTATTIRPKTVKPATKPSPTCSYTYQTKSKIGHPYTVTAATHWRINWTTNGYQGTFNHTYTGSRTLTIGELQSLING